MKPVAKRRRDRRPLTWRRMRAMSWVDAGTWAVAVAVATGLWLLVNMGERTSERTLRVRLEPENLPAGMVIVNPIPDYAEVRVSGSGLILSSIDAKSLHTTLDLSGTRPGVFSYSLDPKAFELPRKVEVTRITPSQVTFHLDTMAKRTIPIRLERTGEVPAGLRLKELTLIPEKIEVTGPKSRLEGMQSLFTAPLDLTRLLPGTQQVDVGLVQPGGLLQLKVAEIRVRTVVEPVIVERSLRRVKLAVKGGERPLRARPDGVTLVLRGPEVELDAIELSPGDAYVDASGLEGPGPYRVKPQVTLPEGIELVRTEPAEVALEPASESPRPAPNGRTNDATEKKS
jgi:YbbR domain-containing protein